MASAVAGAASLRAQVEFYFSDSNLPADSFLMQKITEGQGEEKGFVDLRLICTFSRMREKLRVNRSGQVTDEMINTVASTLEGSDVVQLQRTGDRIMVKRIKELLGKEEATALTDGRSVFARPFPMDSSIDDVTKFFEESMKSGADPSVKVVSVRFRRHEKSKDFNGTIFVEFASADCAKDAIVKASAGDGFTYKGAKLTLMPKVEYVEKTEPVEAKALAEARKKEAEVAAAAAAAAAAEKKDKKEEEVGAAEGEGDDGEGNDDMDEDNAAENGGDDEGAQEEKQQQQDDTLDFVKGIVVRFSVVGAKDKGGEGEGEADAGAAADAGNDGGAPDAQKGLSREDVRASFERFGEIDYIAFSRGGSGGHVQFKDAKAAAAGVAGIESTLKCGDDGDELESISVLSGEDEKKYWANVREMKERKRNMRDGGGRRGGWRGGRGGRGRGRGRGRGGRGGRGPSFKRHSGSGNPSHRDAKRTKTE